MMFEQCSIEVNFMDKAENIKERIIEVTTKLIERCDGNAKSITARMIAEKAGIGLGLINYHFGSKENLITECVQRIIGKVVTEFRMTECFETDKERLTACAIRVFDFLFEHSAISRISILDDLQNFTATCNSAYAQRGFASQMKRDIPDADRPVLTFILTAAMQSAFLGNEAMKQLLGYDFTRSEDRAGYIRKVVNILFEKQESR